MQRFSINQGKVIVGLPPRTPSSSTPDYVSLKGYGKLTAIVVVDNATTVTGSAITLKQAKDVSGTDEKALAFSTMYANTDLGAGEALTETAVTSNTFTTGSTDNKDLVYVMEVEASQLDHKNGFDCVRVGTGNATSAALCVVYILSGGRYAGTQVAATTD